MAFLYGDFLAIPAAVFNLFSSAKRPVFSVSGAWQGSDIPFEMSRTHYFTLQNYHKTTDKQSKIRVFCFAHPTSNTNFAETFSFIARWCWSAMTRGFSVCLSRTSNSASTPFRLSALKSRLAATAAPPTVSDVLTKSTRIYCLQTGAV